MYKEDSERLVSKPLQERHRIRLLVLCIVGRAPPYAVTHWKEPHSAGVHSSLLGQVSTYTQSLHVSDSMSLSPAA